MRDCAVIIVAGGRGRRFGGERLKTLRGLEGRPVVARAAEAFVGVATQWIVVAPDGLETTFERALEPLARDVGGVSVVTGGVRRQDSVQRGLAAVRHDDAVVLVHDGARPLVDRATIDAVRDAVERHGAAIPVSPVHSTVKWVDDGGFIERTLPRDRLRLAQTPQGARRDLLASAFDALDPAVEVTDEAALLESAGIAVYTVPGGADNLKITTQDDLDRAAVILRARQAKGTSA